MPLLWLEGALNATSRKSCEHTPVWVQARETLRVTRAWIAALTGGRPRAGGRRAWSRARGRAAAATAVSGATITRAALHPVQTLAPRVALSIVDLDDPYREAQLRGRVVERRPDPDLRIMDPICHKYTGYPFPFRQPEERVALAIEVETARYTQLPLTHTPGDRA